MKEAHDPNEVYDPRPNAQLMKKVNFYYDAYNKETSLSRHMKFSGNEHECGTRQNWQSLYSLVFTLDKDRREGIM
jgi:hypothetical protein